MVSVRAHCSLQPTKVTHMAVEEAVFKANSKRPWPMKKYHGDDAVKMGGENSGERCVHAGHESA